MGASVSAARVSGVSRGALPAPPARRAQLAMPAGREQETADTIAPAYRGPGYGRSELPGSDEFLKNIDDIFKLGS